jgi:hypothetical protein
MITVSNCIAGIATPALVKHLFMEDCGIIPNIIENDYTFSIEFSDEDVMMLTIKYGYFDFSKIFERIINEHYRVRY